MSSYHNNTYIHNHVCVCPTQLKTYATSQGSVSNIHGDDIAYTLSEERILYPDLDTTDISIYFIFYCLLGLFILFVSLMNVFVSKRLHLIASLSSKLHDHKELAISTILLGYILIVFEFIAMSFYFSDLSTFANLRLYLWMVTTVSFIYVLYLLVKGCITFKKASKEDRIKLLIITTVKLFGVIAVLFYFYLLLLCSSNIFVTFDTSNKGYCSCGILNCIYFCNKCNNFCLSSFHYCGFNFRFWQISLLFYGH